MTNLVTQTAPETIYLQVDDDAFSRDLPFPSDLDGVSWCAESVTECEVEYRRADLPRREVAYEPLTEDEIDGMIDIAWKNQTDLLKLARTIERAVLEKLL